MTPVLLLADNDPEGLTLYRRALEKADFTVFISRNPTETRQLLEDRHVDVAVLDVRLEDDDNPQDISGLTIAIDPAYIHIPKIIMTAFEPSAANLAAALGINADKLPHALAYVGKAAGAQALIDAVRRAVEVWPRLRANSINVATLTRADYYDARTQARSSYKLSLSVSIIGFVLICAGIVLSWQGKLAIGIVGSASGLLSQGFAYMFYRRLDLANERMDRYHDELLQAYWLEFLLAEALCLPSDKRLAVSQLAIETATMKWIGSEGTHKSPIRTNGRKGQKGGQDE